ncbi:MAG: serine/threonine protein kinase [Myxococcales bacterium]|nr:serine/threonine protein kinase [Myxococcales bacterium]
MKTIALREGMRIGGGRYELESRLGRGSMAEVWCARDDKIGRPVAIKVVSEVLAPSELAHRRFAVEVAAIGRIHHPNVVSLFGSGTLADERPFLVMEYVGGEVLSTYLERKGRVGAYTAWMIGRQLLAGLGAAHAEHIIHRDLKPANVLIAQLPSGHRRIKILDFGVARIIERSVTVEKTRLTQSGTMLGSPRYMCLEVARGATDVDERADIFAVGAVLYDALAGRPPFTGTAIGEVIQKIIHHDFPPLIELRPDLPESLLQAINRAMAHDKQDRFQSAEEMQAELDAHPIEPQRRES